jgi:hypothetical protein
MPVCLYVRPTAWNNLPPTGRMFMKLYIWIFFENPSEKIQFPFKPDTNDGYFTLRPIYIYDSTYRAQSFLKWTNQTMYV